MRLWLLGWRRGLAGSVTGVQGQEGENRLHDSDLWQPTRTLRSAHLFVVTSYSSRGSPANNAAGHPTMSDESSSRVIARIEMIGVVDSTSARLASTRRAPPRASEFPGDLVWVNRVVAPEPLTAETLHVGSDVSHPGLLSRPVMSPSQRVDVGTKLRLSLENTSITLDAVRQPALSGIEGLRLRREQHRLDPSSANPSKDPT